MRIVGGKYKGRVLLEFKGKDIRPTSDKARESLFNILQFKIAGATFLDLFCGTGAMGIEALSRGAASVMFIDSAREAIDVVKENARFVGFFDKSRFLVSDYRNYIRKASGRDKFDLVFIDPPYAMQCCAEAAKKLSESGMLADGAILVLESGEEEIDLSSLTSFEVIKSTHYGKKSFVNILLYKETADA